MLDFMLHAFAILFVTLDPIGLAPLFLAVTRHAPVALRPTIAVRASLIAAAILIVFALLGTRILTFLGISLAAFRVAGGLLLFWIAFEMVFEKRDKRKQATAEQALNHASGEGQATEAQIHVGEDPRHLAVFPLAIPLISGPGAISATILLAGEAPDMVGQALLIGLILILIASCLAVFLAANQVDRYLGETGRSVLTRLLGVLLSALAVQFVADGIKALMQ